MGGKRNAARARSKDTTRRTHKAHFGRQRLDILTNGLLSRNTTSNAFGPRATASDIELSHVKQSENDSDAFIPGPHRPMKAGQSSEKRRSRVLEALHTAELTCTMLVAAPHFQFLVALAMRAAMDQILSMPDLAGLSTRRTPERKRPRGLEDSDSPCPPRKRHLRSTVSLAAPPQCLSQKGQNARSSSFSATKSADDVEFKSMDIEQDCNSLKWSTKRSLNRRETGFHPFKETHIILRSYFPPLLWMALLSQIASPKNAPGFRFRNNLYDHQHPWNVVGVMLGLEESLPEGVTEEEFQNPGLDDEGHDADDDDTASVYSFASNESLGSFVK